MRRAVAGQRQQHLGHRIGALPAGRQAPSRRRDAGGISRRRGEERDDAMRQQIQEIVSENDRER